MKKLVKLLIGYGTVYMVGKLVKDINKKELKNLKPLNIDVGKINPGSIDNVVERLMNMKFETPPIQADSIISTTSKINELKIGIEELKNAINCHEKEINELSSKLSAIVAKIQ